MNTNKVTLTVTNRTIFRAIVWVVGSILVYRFVGRISHGLILIFASIFLALALNPVVTWMTRHLKVRSRVRATALAYGTIILLITAFILLVTPPLIHQTRTFISDAPSTVQNFQNQNSKVAQSARKYHLDQKLSQAAKNFSSHYGNFGSTALDTGKRILEAMASLLAVLVLTFMMLVEGPSWLKLFWGVVPVKNREHHKRIVHKMYLGVTGFVNGQVVLALIAGTFAFVALEIASHVTQTANINPLALAGIVAVFGLIPLLGNPIAATMVILLCLINSATLGLVMLIYFIVYFFIENHTFQPYIQSRLNDLTPLTVFVAAILGVGFGGLMGAIIAIPAASAVKIIIEDYFERRNSTDKAPTTPETA